MGDVSSPHYPGVNLARAEGVLRAKNVMVMKVQAALDLIGAVPFN
jgi:hypothetical protein